MDYEELERISNNPARVVNTLFNRIEEAWRTDDVKINSAGQPFSLCMDMIVASNYMYMNKISDGLSSSYLCHARTLSDLSKKMSDEDWYGVFAEPSVTTFRYIISEESILAGAIRYDDIDGTLNNSYRKIVIPGDTQFYVAGIPFLLENPIEIRAMDHGGYQVVYDINNQSPLNPLKTNTPEKEVLSIDNRRWLAAHLPLRQLEVTAHPNLPSNVTSGFKNRIEFKDSLYAVRAFITPEGSNQLIEMAVVYNNEIFDPNQITLTVDLDTGAFDAGIPIVYTQNGLGLGRVTILVYTTKGEMYRDLTTLKSQEHKIAYYNYNNQNGALGKYEANLKTINETLIDTIAPINGGRNAMTFQEIKDMMIYGHKRRLIPISIMELNRTIISAGYSSVKYVEDVTKRLYRITKDLPSQDVKQYETDIGVRYGSAIGCYNGSILTSLEEIIGAGWGIDNGNSISLPRGCVFDVSQQTPRMLTVSEVKDLVNSSNQAKIDLLSDRTLVFNPFMYILDTSNDRADIRAYHIRTPEIKYQTFRYENVNLGLQLGIGGIAIESVSDGYVINIVTKSSDAYKNISDDLTGVQMSIPVADTTSEATIRGKLLGKDDKGERYWQFKLSTRFNIDELDKIDFAGFNLFGRPADTIRTGLSELITFIFTYGGDHAVLKSQSDNKIDQSLFKTTNISIIETQYRIDLGTSLKSMYTRVRPVTDTEKYVKHTTNVPETYKANEYRYENGKLYIDPDTQLPVIIHRAGDPVYNSDGSPRWEFTVGQTVYNEHGEPVLLEGRKIKYHWDFFGFDYNFLLTQDEYDIEYLKSIDSLFVNKLLPEVDGFNKLVLDESVIKFKPKTTMGYTRVIIGDSIEKLIKSDLSFVIEYSLTERGINDSSLKNSLVRTTHQAVNNLLKNNTVSVSDIVTKLRKDGGNDILDVSVKMIAGGDEIRVVTNIDETNGFSIRKVLDQTSDKVLSIKEDIDILFRRHKPRDM